MYRLTLAILFAAAAMPGGLYAQISVPSGFEVVPLASQLPGGVAPQLEAVRNPAYGSGVLGAVAKDGKLLVYRLAPGSSSTLTTITTPDSTQVLTLRFDTTGQFGEQLFVSALHNNDDGNPLYQTDVWQINPNGSSNRQAFFGSKPDPTALRFDFSKGGNYQVGMYLVDSLKGGGRPLYLLNPVFSSTVLKPDVLPNGRSSFNPVGVEFDRTGAYGGYFMVADADPGDDVSVVYGVRADLTFALLHSGIPLATLSYVDLAVNVGGDLGEIVYATDAANDWIVTVSSTGSITKFATGFSGIGSISAGASGDELYVADANGVYMIREEPPPPEPEASYRCAAVGVSAASLQNGSFALVGQTIVNRASDGTSVVNPGALACVFGSFVVRLLLDFDGDLDVDLDDMYALTQCLDGPDVAVDEPCASGDGDHDGDADLRDAAMLQTAYTGAAQ